MSINISSEFGDISYNSEAIIIIYNVLKSVNIVNAALNFS